MDISETDLPGVGKRFEVPLGSGRTAIIVIHNNGRREVFYRDDPDEDAQEVFSLTDQESRIFGTILEGAYFQPIRSDIPETILGDDVILEWYALTEDDAIVGRSIGEADVRSRYGVTVLAVEREGNVHTNPDPTFTFQAGDTIVAIGSREDQRSLEADLGA